jgi:hypothetical protein
MLFWNDGRVYSGQLKQNSFHGFGTFKFPDNTTYKGEWLENKRHGYGKFSINSSGAVYKGFWLDDKRHGYGIFTWGDYAYEGESKSGRYDGYGTEMLKGSYRYKGTFKDNKKDGHGVCVY